MSVDEYMELMNEMNQLMYNPTFWYSIVISIIMLIIISLLICTAITRSAKLSKKCILFGLLGTTGIFMLLCMVMAKSVGLSKNFVWLGLLGIYGVIIMAVVMGVTSYRKINSNKNDSYYYEKRTKENEMDKDWQNNAGMEHNREDGYYLNGKFYKRERNAYDMENDRGTICLNCGSAVEAGVDKCPRCGNRVR